MSLCPCLLLVWQRTLCCAAPLPGANHQELKPELTRTCHALQAPLDSLDLSLVSILYTQGNMAAFTPSFNYNFQILNTSVQISSWRQLLYWLGPPGILPGLPMRGVHGRL